ncbi:hypothetical protein RhiirA1_371428 [Rhizophagus irregularis]|uniref:Uncharacterized protein n=1 Tax=Rhizophagus irregularis TaxID=588596 RepID=A0A2N0QPK6_9GLOM|nr:hypothetical protein RhiirA1_371428 [Rhizophagus irregularis]
MEKLKGLGHAIGCSNSMYFTQTISEKKWNRSNLFKHLFESERKIRWTKCNINQRSN